MFLLSHRLATAGYCDAKGFNINEAAKKHEAPAVEKALLLDDKKKLRDRENLSKLITIPVEVSCYCMDFPSESIILSGIIDRCVLLIVKLSIQPQNRKILVFLVASHWNNSKHDAYAFQCRQKIACKAAPAI